MDLLAYAGALQARHEARTSQEARKARGQVFTPPEVARFMAGLFTRFPKETRLLDPGAGIGTLAAAVCERFLAFRTPYALDIHLVETDPYLLPVLRDNMEHCQHALLQAGHRMRYTIHTEDFITSNAGAFEQRGLFSDSVLGAFDIAISNPPYFKVNKDSAHARIMERVVHGQPNIYALFLALTAALLRPQGELAAITPRSFCNGLYFRGFRRWFFERMALRYIHLFESRTQTFKEANVLQESIVTLTERAGVQPERVTISTSVGRDFSKTFARRDADSAAVRDDACGDMVIRIPETARDERIVRLIEAWPARFADLGLRVSTGPVVLFRATEFLREEPNGASTAPLLSQHNVRPFETVWPLERRGKPAALADCPATARILVPTRNYVLLRRFSAKEERRRLTASCLFRSEQPHPYVGLENHLNYVYHAEHELTVHETYGIAALFNSALLDRYFRTLSGNTQVNATEVRTMPFPDLGVIARIGKRVRLLKNRCSAEVERVVLSELGVNGELERHLIAHAL